MVTRKISKGDAEFGDFIHANRSQLETRGRKANSLPVPELQKQTLEFFAQGLTVAQVMAKVDRTAQTYQLWRARTPEYAKAVDHIRAKMKGEPTKDVGDFASFRKEYLGVDTFPHQFQWVDLLEKREPRLLHEKQVYRAGSHSKDRVLVNTPPNHGKSTTITMDYVTYRICKDPKVRVLILSASNDMANKFVLGIKERLSHPKYNHLIEDFGPSATGFQDPRLPWTGRFFYVAGRDPEQKDPTVEALGINGHIYGARADIIILDDCVTLKTTRTKGMREKTLSFIRKEVASRLEPDTGILLVVGTRLASDDLYGEILRQDESKHRWTYLTQPAVLEYADDPNDWQTLWPERFPGRILNDILSEYGDDAGDFNLVYQQESAPSDATFPEAAVRGCTTTDRGIGKIPDHVRAGGMAGLYVVGGVDPASSGHTAIVLLGVDKRTRQRYVVDCLNQRGMKPHDLRAKMIEWTKTYKVNEWRIEKNGLQTLLSQDRDLRMAILANGSRIFEHHTVEYGQSGKWDPDYGVASLAPLFLGALETPRANLVTIPYNGTHRATRELIDQFINWEPQTVGKTDLVMAFWFADLGCRKQLVQVRTSHVENRWATRSGVAKRAVVNLQDYLDAGVA